MTSRPDTASFSTFSNRKLFAFFFILSAILLVDVTIGSSQDIFLDFAISSEGFVLFIIIAAISIFSQLYIIRMIKSKNMERKDSKRFHLGKFETPTTIVQYILTAIMVFIILQIAFMSQYNTDLLTAGLTISYGLVIYLSSILAYKFFSWFRTNRSLAVLLYGIASAMIVANAIDTIILFGGMLIEKPDIVSVESEVIYEGNFEPGHPLYIQSLTMAITQTAYFLLIWGATVVLLYHNIKRIGKIRFWSLVTPPLLFFMSFYIGFYETLNPPDPEEVPPLLMYILLVIYSMIAAGVFFGVGFLSIARSPKVRGYVRDYMFITGYAFILFIISSISVIHQAGYPPYGFASITTVSLASFLMITGLYNSAVAVSEDVQLRRSLKIAAKGETKLIDSIGSAEMQKEIERKVIEVAKQNTDILTKRSGIEPSMNDQEIMDYLHQATKELKAKETRSAD